jgi:vacuolar-type H+-ATPase subunit E/Vma4
MAETELTREQKARIASRAQAEAHRALREARPDEYSEAYQAAKERLEQEAGA